MEGDYVEMNVYDLNNSFLYQIYPFQNYRIPGNFKPGEEIYVNELEFSPDQDLQNLGLYTGTYNIEYNILRPKIVNTPNKIFFIKEISANRTEIRLSTNNISATTLSSGSLSFIDEFQSLGYFKEFYINLGGGVLIPASNIALDQNTTVPTVLIKLINPLPNNIAIQALASIADKISNTQLFQVSQTLDPVQVTYPSLRGPNFDLDIDNVRANPTDYYNYSDLTNSGTGVNSHLQSLLGAISSSVFDVNIDYTDYSNFIHFSSAARRLEGFKYKLESIEIYTANSASAVNNSNITSQLDAQSYQNQINEVIQSFDGYEKFLYYESSSYAWPKQTSTKPYINQSVTSSESILWYSDKNNLSVTYDENNQDYIIYALPGYINENSINEDLFKFVASIGQMFDDIWIHIKAITDLYQSRNSLTEGISKDLVYFALQSLGINAYTDKDGENTFQYLYGVNPDGTYLPATSSYETLVTASQYQLSGQDQQKGIYKRLYHNLPLLLKSKGTTRFVQYLNTIFGIPSTIMGYTEYGGVDKTTSTFEYEYDRFTYGLNLANNSYITTPWPYLIQSLNRTGYNDIKPDAIELRIKPYVTTPSSDMLSSFPTQSILFLNNSTYGFFSLDLIYTQTGSSDSIYSGSVGDFGYFKMTTVELNTLSTSSSISPTIPIFTTGSDGETSWYNILLQRRYPNKTAGDENTPQYYDLYVKNNVYGEVGHATSASLYIDGAYISGPITFNSSWYNEDPFGTVVLQVGEGNSYPGYIPSDFTGSLQELRLWSNYVSESAFNFHVLNPESIEGNTTSSAYNDLAARWPLGNDLYTYNHNTDTVISSVAPDQVSQIIDANFINFLNENNYSSFVETYYANAANSGYANPVADKIRIVSGSEYGTQLMPNKSIEVKPIIPTTKDIHLMDASLSPQDEIDRDIIANLGSLYSIDDMIGDPTGAGYADLTVLREEYFKKYINKYNYKDYIRLIEFFHNSLFRTLKDFIPARTNLATGIVIKPHILERSNEEIGDPTVERTNNLSQSIDTLFITASNGGNYTQPTYSYTIPGKAGPVVLTSDARDFYTGELPSASIFIHSEFNKANANPYIYFESDHTSSVSESFWNVGYNPLLNNVSQNQTSSRRQTLSLIGGDALFTSGSSYVTESIQYQDFTDHYARHTRGRYEGSKVSSLLYNQYSPGDSSYGKTSAIDSNTTRFAFFSEAIATGSGLMAMPERTNLYIRYLIDETGSLSELTKHNYDTLRENQKSNLYEVQRIFKSGETINVGLFDSQNPSRQSSLDGNKTIFAGGYRYEQLLYRTASEWLVYELDPNIYPNGVSVSTLYPPSQFNITVQYLGVVNPYYPVSYSYKFTITRALGPVSEPTTISYNYTANGGTSVQNGTVNMYSGQSTVEFYIYLGVSIPSGIIAYAVSTTNVTNYYDGIAADINAFLTLDSSDKTIISASFIQSVYYPGFVFTSSFSNLTTYTDTGIDRNFVINKGDLIRFQSASKFIVQEEYEIVDVYPPTSLGQYLAFKVNRPVHDVATSSATPNRIENYIFSNKIPDETNIIITHRKRDGQTSSGIAKNGNISLEVDDKIANVVGELKTGVLSTVLIP